MMARARCLTVQAEHGAQLGCTLSQDSRLAHERSTSSEMNKIRCQIRCHTARRAHINAGLAVGHPKYPRECTLSSYRFHHVAARSCTQAKPELAAAALPHLRHSRKPSLGGKAFKTERPTVFFPLDPKKRHLHWATWWVFGSSDRPLVAFPKIRKSATTNLKTGGASALPFLRPFSRWHCVRRGKVEGRRYTVLYTYGFDSSTPEVPAIASRLTHYWMRHPHPLISLLSLMLLCSIRATSHEQPLDDLPLSSRRLPSMRITAACARSPPISVT
jgi:hypothetical protein